MAVFKRGKKNWMDAIINGHHVGIRNLFILMAPQVRLELTTLRLTAK